MREIKRRSAVPVYIAAGVYALYALIFPLYNAWHFLFAAVVTAAAWLIADRLIKPVVEYVPEQEEEPEEPVSYGTEADAILAEAKTARREMERLAASIGDEAVRQRITRLITLSDQIAQDAIQDPSDIPQIKKFQGYFLPSTVQLLNAYDRMASLGTEGENITATKQRITEMLDTEITAFEKQLDALYKNDYL
ncbi:MAG: 5-bromo-4-chloroindolyl phosphate hydrolysis family protein, partial [Oscillospiraceae bacterium]|nr:5-bromo-4-chloroindolyl phosphate hydrolysis family protein [Oscillospiraceae bacterium]